MAPNAASGDLQELSGSFWSISLLSCGACGYALWPTAGIHDFQVPPRIHGPWSGEGKRLVSGPYYHLSQIAKQLNCILQYSNTATLTLDSELRLNTEDSELQTASTSSQPGGP